MSNFKSSLLFVLNALSPNVNCWNSGGAKQRELNLRRYLAQTVFLLFALLALGTESYAKDVSETLKPFLAKCDTLEPNDTNYVIWDADIDILYACSKFSNNEQKAKNEENIKKILKSLEASSEAKADFLSFRLNDRIEDHNEPILRSAYKVKKGKSLSSLISAVYDTLDNKEVIAPPIDSETNRFTEDGYVFISSPDNKAKRKCILFVFKDGYKSDPIEQDKIKKSCIFRSLPIHFYLVPAREMKYPSFSIKSATTTEGSSLKFDIVKEGEQSLQIASTLNFETLSGSASEDDYGSLLNTNVITFEPTETTKVVSVETIDDKIYEGDEKLSVRIYNPSHQSTISTEVARGLIKDNDPKAIVSVSDGQASEGEVLEFRIEREAGISKEPISINYSFIGGTAGNEDFDDTPGAVQFSQGELEKAIYVTTFSDEESEEAKEFQIVLKANKDIRIQPSIATGTIENVNNFAICWDGSKASSLAECPPKPPKTKVCWDESIVPLSATCPTKPIKCWDGREVGSLDECIICNEKPKISSISLLGGVSVNSQDLLISGSACPGRTVAIVRNEQPVYDNNQQFYSALADARGQFAITIKQREDRFYQGVASYLALSSESADGITSRVSLEQSESRYEVLHPSEGCPLIAFGNTSVPVGKTVSEDSASLLYVKETRLNNECVFKFSGIKPPGAYDITFSRSDAEFFTIPIKSRSKGSWEQSINSLNSRVLSDLENGRVTARVCERTGTVCGSAYSPNLQFQYELFTALDQYLQKGGMYLLDGQNKLDEIDLTDNNQSKNATLLYLNTSTPSEELEKLWSVNTNRSISTLGIKNLKIKYFDLLNSEDFRVSQPVSQTAMNADGFVPKNVSIELVYTYSAISEKIKDQHLNGKLLSKFRYMFEPVIFPKISRMKFDYSIESEFLKGPMAPPPSYSRDNSLSNPETIKVKYKFKFPWEFFFGALGALAILIGFIRWLYGWIKEKVHPRPDYEHLITGIVREHLNENKINRKVRAHAKRIVGDEVGLFDKSESSLELQRYISDGKVVNPYVFIGKLNKATKKTCLLIGPDGAKFGTGFLISDDQILTNYHVYQKSVQSGIELSQMKAVFDYATKSDGRGVNTGHEIDFDHEFEPIFSPTSSENDLDYACFKLTEKVGLGLVTQIDGAKQARGFHNLPRNEILLENSADIFVFHHPGGGTVKCSLGKFKSYHPAEARHRVRYDANTISGSSGGAVVNAEFRLVALHHAADGANDPQFNQGIPVHLIKNDIDRQLAERTNS